MTKFSLVLIASIASLGAYADEVTLRCEMTRARSAETRSLDITTNSKSFRQALADSADSKAPFTAAIRFTSDASEETAFQAKPFGFEPDMYQAQNVNAQDPVQYAITYDRWAAPVFVITAVENGIYWTSSQCDRRPQ